ncbi:hypothetical protein DL95DRAFT_481761 [Leptodontidium sp. 2 PMI_412]|nr:hypothetical protein DL95DRAFT_481761 [Leptodontidium sp. 2 PMI_412]
MRYRKPSTKAVFKNYPIYPTIPLLFKKRLRDRAAELIAGREDVEIEEDETTGGRKQVYPDAYGAVVDKSSAKGSVAITVHGFSVQQVDTGQGLIGEPYAELTYHRGWANMRNSWKLYGTTLQASIGPRFRSCSTIPTKSGYSA